MHPPKVDITGTYIYTLTFHLSPTCIHIVGVNQAYVLNDDHDTDDEVIDR